MNEFLLESRTKLFNIWYDFYPQCRGIAIQGFEQGAVDCF